MRWYPSSLCTILAVRRVWTNAPIRVTAGGPMLVGAKAGPDEPWPQLGVTCIRLSVFARTPPDLVGCNDTSTSQRRDRRLNTRFQDFQNDTGVDYASKKVPAGSCTRRAAHASLFRPVASQEALSAGRRRSQAKTYPSLNVRRSPSCLSTRLHTSLQEPYLVGATARKVSRRAGSQPPVSAHLKRERRVS